MSLCRVNAGTGLLLSLMCLIENLSLIHMFNGGFILCTGNIKENYRTQQECSFMGKK